MPALSCFQIYQKTLSAPIWVHFSASGLYQKCSFELPMSVLLRLLCSAQIVCIVPHEPAGKSQIKYKYLQERNATTKGTSKAPMCALSRVLCKLHIYIYSTRNTTDVLFQKRSRKPPCPTTSYLWRYVRFFRAFPAQFKTMLTYMYIYSTPNATDLPFQKAVEADAMFPLSKFSLAIFSFCASAPFTCKIF